MRYAEYEQWLDDEHSKFVVGSECTQLGPFLTPTIDPNKPPWQMEWAIVFDDGLFFRVTENWFKRKSMGGRGIRHHHSFHYGPANPDRDQYGIPKRSAAYPAIIRVDVDRRGPHLHYAGNDHIPQNKVKGFDIADAEPFVFAEAVMQHRRTGESFEKILKFTLIP
jgi:hypothetical protein